MAALSTSLTTRKIADLTVDPVTDQLDPAVTAAGPALPAAGLVFEPDREAGAM